jgi:hypothetical protein
MTGLAVANSDDGDGLAILLLPIVIGLGLIATGYRKFRYGEEVELLQKSARKALLGRRGSGEGLYSIGRSLLESGFNFNRRGL